MTYGSSASYTSGGTSQVTIVQPGGTTLRFDQTGYVLGMSTSRCRISSIADRNGNKLAFSYSNSLATGSDDVMVWTNAVDSYGGTTSFTYTSSTASGNFSGLNLLSKVTFSDSRSVTYAYTSDNLFFCHEIDYYDASLTLAASSTWYQPEHSAMVRWRDGER